MDEWDDDGKTEFYKMETLTAEYHSHIWQDLVEQGWITAETFQDEDRNIAIMVRGG